MFAPEGVAVRGCCGEMPPVGLDLALELGKELEGGRAQRDDRRQAQDAEAHSLGVEQNPVVRDESCAGSGESEEEVCCLAGALGPTKTSPPIGSRDRRGMEREGVAGVSLGS